MCNAIWGYPLDCELCQGFNMPEREARVLYPVEREDDSGSDIGPYVITYTEVRNKIADQKFAC